MRLPLLAGLIGIGGLLGSAAAADNEAQNVASGISYATAVAVLCAEQTGGEVGAPVPVIMTYRDSASREYLGRYGKSIDTLTNFDEAAKTLRAAPGAIAKANRDEWPPVCDQQLGA